MKKITITDRDYQLLNLLSQCGVMKPEQTKMAYGNVTEYHLKRIQKLIAARVLIRDNGYIRPSASGLRMAGIQARPMHLERYHYEEHALAVELVSQLPLWSPVYARELKRIKKIQNSSGICVTISKDNTQYAIYIITKDTPEGMLKLNRSEISNLPLSGINRVLVFYTSDSIMQTVGFKPPDGLRECCLLRYPEGVASLKRWFSPEFQSFMQTRFPGMKPCSRPFAHFEHNGDYVTVLIHNDLLIRAALIDYVTHAQQREHRRCVAVCTPGQEIDIPGVEVVYDTVDE